MAADRNFRGNSAVPGPRIAREKATVTAMMKIYCQDHHSAVTDLCPECEKLRQYALQRLGVCPFSEKKPVCNRCEIHCYSVKKRERMKEIMRYAGPRMLLKHPVLALRHLLDKLRPSPTLGSRPKR